MELCCCLRFDPLAQHNCTYANRQALHLQQMDESKVYACCAGFLYEETSQVFVACGVQSLSTQPENDGSPSSWLLCTS